LTKLFEKQYGVVFPPPGSNFLPILHCFQDIVHCWSNCRWFQRCISHFRFYENLVAANLGARLAL